MLMLNRSLKAVVNVKGKIICWKCTACNWSKLPDDPFSVTEKTKILFKQHACAEHCRSKATHARKMISMFRMMGVGCKAKCLLFSY